jgi:hypothetical protein
MSFMEVKVIIHILCHINYKMKLIILLFIFYGVFAMGFELPIEAEEFKIIKGWKVIGGGYFAF